MAVFNKFEGFVEHLAEGVHNLGTSTLKVYLVNASSAPVGTLLTANTIKSNVAEIPTGNGYVLGGVQATVTASSQTSGTYKLVLADAIFTAAAGTIGPFRYAVLYNSSAASNNLIGFYDYGSNVTLLDGESLTVDFDPSNGALTLA